MLRLLLSHGNPSCKLSVLSGVTACLNLQSLTQTAILPSSLLYCSV